MWEFVEAVRGLGAACRALGLPVVSGNVSFYNETAGEGSIPPTPTIGMLGLLEEASLAVPAAFAATGDCVLLLGENLGELGGSEYLSVRHGLERGTPPVLDLEAEGRLHAFLVEAAKRGLLRSAHDIADGGVAVSLAECALRSSVGLRVDVSASGLRPEANLFGESASRAVVSCLDQHRSALLALAGEMGVPAQEIGETGGDRICIAPGVDVALSEAHDVWTRTLPEALG